MAAKKKVYDVRWEDGDGEQGYYARMTSDEAEKVLRFLTVAADKDIVKNPKVDALEGDRVVTASGLIEEFKARYHGA